MSWRLAKSLETLRTQIDAQWPSRNKASDGTIADAAHASTVSQHNPNSFGVVTAMDITHDPKNGPDGSKLAAQLIKDSRTWYVIWNRRIWEVGVGWQPYVRPGSNPHDHHVHISTKQTPMFYDNPKKWSIISAQKGDIMNRGDVININYHVMGKMPSEARIKLWTGKSAIKFVSALTKTKGYVPKALLLEGVAKLKAEIAELKKG